jgi:hypothetical protein
MVGTVEKINTFLKLKLWFLQQHYAVIFLTWGL